MIKPGDAWRTIKDWKRQSLLEGALHVRFTPRRQNPMDNGYTIQLGILDRRTRMRWKTLRHADGTKPIMVFPKRTQAMRHANWRKKCGEQMIRIVAPDGTVEGPL